MKKIKLLVFISLFAVISCFAQSNAKVYYVELKEGVDISPNPVKEYSKIAEKTSGKRLVIYPDIEFQTIEGIGGSFNEIGGEAIMSLPNEERESVMQHMFSLKNGAGFSFCRTAVGASDFGIDAYSYSEKSNDFNMKHFSVKRERKTVLPYIQMAYRYNPKLKMFASPWSPPGWMKYSGLMDRGVEFPEKNHLKDDPKIYKAYALYFSKYIQEYAKNGIVIDRLVIQNENDVPTKYPSCIMPPKQMGLLAKEYIRPAFKENNIGTEIWAGSFRTAEQNDAIEFVSNPELRNAVDGIGIQYTKVRYIQDMLSQFPSVKMMHTEGNCYNGKNSVEQAKKRLEEIASYINSGCPNYCYWNMILNETGKSGWDWKQNSLINIDREAKMVTYNPDYAVVSLISKFLQPGVKRIAAFSRSSFISVANNKEIVVLVQNDNSKPDTYECWIKDKKTVVEIPANSVAAIILSK